MKKIYLANFEKIKVFIFALGFLLLPASMLFAQTVTPYSTPGTYTFTAPVGVFSITVSSWGGGAAGGGVNGQTKAGGGGEGGSFVRGTISVLPGATYTVVVGSGGAGVSTANGGSGLASSFSVSGGGATLFNAIGGVGGNAGTTASNFGAGGNSTNTGNIISGSTTSNFYGGNGGNATNASSASSGGGGGSAGAGNGGGNGGSPLTAGTAGSGSGVPADAGVAGSAGRGSGSDGNGIDAGSPGGGGSGGRNANNSTSYRGGNGGNGQVILIYTPLTYKSSILSVTPASVAPWCPGETRSVQVSIKNTGTATWTDGTGGTPLIRVGVKWNTNGLNWNDYFVRIPAGNLAPGSTTTFTLPLTASNYTLAAGTYTTPLSPGTNNLIFDVVYEGVSWFGDNLGGTGLGNVKFTSSAVTINASPAITTQPSASTQTICQSSASAALSVVATGAGLTYQWYSNTTALNSGGTSISGATSSSYIPLTTTVGTLYYYCIVSGSCTPAATSNISGKVTVNPRPTAVISGTQAICNGSSATLSLAVTGSGTISGTLSDGTAFSGTAPTITVAVSPSATTTYTISTLTDGCVSIAADKTGTATVTVNPRPTAILSGTQAVCNGGSATLSLAVTGSGTISGTLSDGTAFSGTAPTITVAVSPSATITYTISTLTNGCVSIAADKTGTAIVTVNPRPTAVLTGTQAICNGSSGTLSLAVTGSGTISGTLSDGTAFSGTAPTITVAVSPSSTITYTISTLTNGCVSIAADMAGTATVTVNPRPTAILSGSQAICNGGSATLSLAVTGSGTISGTLPDGTAFSGTAPTITVAVSPSATITYTISTLTNGCVSIAADITGTAIVTVNEPVVITSNPGPATQTVCGASSVTYTVAATGTSLTYQWLKDGTPISNGGTISGANTATLKITGAQLNDNGDYSVVVSGLSPCASATSTIVTLVVDQKILFTVQPATPLTICEGQPYTISTTATGTVATSIWNHNGSLYGNASVSGNVYTLTIPAVVPADAGNYQLVLDDGTGIGCTAANSNVAVLTVNPTPVATISGSTTGCQSSSPAPLVTFTNPQALPVTITYNINSGGDLTINVGANTSATIAAPTGTAGTFNYNLVSVSYQSGPGCSNAITGTAIITVNPTPDATAIPSSQSICSAGGITNIVLTGSVPGTTFPWTRDNASVTGIATSGSGDISGTLTNSTAAPIIVTFTVTPIASTCVGTPITTTVLVNPTPNAIATPSSQTICSGFAITTIALTSTTAGTTYAWTRDNAGTVTGIAAGGSGNISGSLTNTTAVPVTVTFTITPTANGCDGNAITATVLVNPTPDALATPASQTICSGTAITAIALTSTTAGTTYTWTRDNTIGVTGMTASGSGNSIIGTLTNTTTAPITVTFTITPTASTCGGTTTTATVLVNPSPNTVRTPSSQTICSGSTITTIALTSATTGTTYTWTRDNTGTVTGIAASGTGDISGSLTNTTFAPITITFTIIPTANSCAGASSTATVLVNPTANAIATPSSQTKCSGIAISTIALSSSTTGTSYTWTRDNTGTVTGIAASGSGASITGTLTNTTASPITVTFTITPTANGCIGTQTTATVLVNPTANSIPTPSAQTICSGNAITTIALSSTTTGTTFTWTRNNTATVTGIAASGNGDISGSLTNTTAAAVTVTFTITPSANGCTGTPTTATVLVNPTPNAIATPSSQTKCSGVAITAIALTSSTTGTTFTWTRDNTGTVTGIASSGSGTSISGTLTNTTTAPITITFTITPTANSCVGIPATATVLVNPTPNAIATPPSQTICSGTAITAIALTSSTTGTTYTWTRDNTVGVTGLAASGSGNSISGTLTNTTTAPITVTFTITPTASTCGGTTTTATVLVNPSPNTVRTPSSQTICSGATITTIALTSTTTGSTFTWTRNNTATVTGIGATGSGDISGSLINTTAAAVTVTFTITPSANGCTGAASTATVLVNPTPNAIATPSSQTKCSGIALTAIALSSSTAGTTYTWTRDNTGTVTGIAASGSGNITGSLTNTTTAPITVTFTITPTFSGCPGSPITATVLVNPKPTAGAITGGSNVCIGSTITLAPAGAGIGTLNYAWASSIASVATVNSSGVVTGVGAGTTQITYTVTDANGCTSVTSANFPVTVTKPTANAITQASGISTICMATKDTLTSNASGVATLTYTWSSSNNGVATVSITGIVTGVTAGTANITYTVTDGNGCQNTSPAFSITVKAIATGTLTASATTICAGATVTFTATSGFSLYKFYVNGVVVRAANASPTYSSSTLNNSDIVSVEVFNSLSCSTFFNAITMTVNPLPTPTLSAAENSGTPNNNIICAGANVTFTATGGTNYNFKVNGSSQVSGPSNTYSTLTLNNADVVTVDVTDGNSCTATSAPITITVSAVPNGTLTASATSICPGNNVTFTATGGTSYQFYLNGTIAQSFSSVSTYSSTLLADGDIITVDVSNAAGCTVTFTPGIAINVNPSPTGALTATENSGTPNDYNICAGAPVTFTFSTTGYSIYNFKVNSISKQSGPLNSYTTTTLASGDVVTIDVTSGSSCAATFTAPAVIIATSPVGTLSASPASICAGDNVTFTATSDPAFTNYNFKVNGAGGQNGPGNTFSSTTIANGDVVTVDVTNSNSCVTTFNSLTLTVNPLPTGTLVPVENSGNTPNDGIICTAATVVFTAPTGFTNYNFILNGVSVLSGASNTYSNSSLANGDKIDVAVTNGGGCIGLLNQVIVTVNTLPVVAAITGPISVCVNSTTTLADATTGGTWSSLNTGIATIDAAGVVTGLSAGTAAINYTITNANGCTGVATVVVTVNTLPTVGAIGGNLNVCVGNTTQLTDATSGGTWSSSDNAIATISTTGLVNGISDGATTISYTVTNGNGCTIITTATVTVHALPLVDVITGTTSVCVNSTTTLSDLATGGLWSSSNPAVATVNASTGVVTGIGGGTSLITYTITDINSCSSVTTATITVNALPTPTLVGPSPICLGSIDNVYTTESGQFNYVWNVVNGTATSGGTSTDNTVTVSWLTPGAKSISVNYTDANGCTGAASATVVNAPGSSPIITGPAPVCQNSVNNVYSTQAGKIDYTWNVNGGTITSGGTIADPTATVTWNVAGAKSISVNYSDIAGCDAATPTVYNVTVNPQPIVTIHDPAQVCSPSTANLTVPGITSGSTAGLTYTYWTDATATTSYPTPATAGAGTYYIKGTTASGCSDIQPVNVTVSAAPLASISYTGGPFCTSSVPVPVNQTGTPGGTYFSTGGLTINSVNGTITPSTSTGGTYTVTYTVAAGGGCTIYNTTSSVTITTAPSATISYSGGPFCTSSAPINVTMTGTGGGTYSSTAGLIINSSTGIITPATSTNGTYLVTYTIIASGGCAQFTATASVTITTAPSATISYTGSPFCTNAIPANITRTGTAGGTYSSSIGLTINGATGTITPATSTGGIYIVTYTITGSGGCATFTTTTSLTITPAPTAVAGPNVLTCSNSGAINITAGSSATNQSSVLWTTSGTAGTISNATSLTTAVYTPSAADITAGVVTLTLKAIGNGSCATATSTKTVTISAVPNAFIITPASAAVCLGDVQPLSASASVSSTGTQMFSSTSNNLAIPDNSATGAVSTINVSGIPAGAVINSISVNFNVTHGYVSELVLNLKAPNANAINLVNQRGGSGNNFTNTTLSSTSLNPVNSGTAPFTNTYSADAANGVGATGNVSNIAAFSSLYSTPNGNWSFSAEDVVNCQGFSLFGTCFGTVYTGVLNNWSITINYTIPNSPLGVTWSPSTDLYTDPGATTPYAGQSLSTVYSKPATSGSVIYTAKATNVANCSTSQTVTLTVNPKPAVTISADYCAVAGKVRLTANSVPAATSWIWSNGAITQSIDVDIAGSFDVTAFGAGSCPGKASINVATELVINGGFESGNVGFTSPPLGANQYQYQADIAGNNELVPEGLYGIGPNAQTYHSNFWGHDHTTGLGNFMIINGFPNGNPQPIVWQETVNVLPNTTYYFSAWGMSLNASGPFATLQFNVNGAQVGTNPTLPAGVTNNTNNGWTRFYGTWTSGPTTTTAVISITDLQNATGGNDFGIDDISFGTLSTFITLQSAPGTDAQTVCKNAALTNIVYNVGNGNASGPTVSPLPNGITSIFVGNTLTISGTPTIAGNYTYTITTTGCNPTSVTGTINVQQQKITLSSGSASPTICVNTPVSIGYTLSGTATGATITGLTGATGSLSGNIFTLTWTPTVAGSYPYAVITSGTGCTPDTAKGTITVQSQTITLNSAIATTAQTVCVNTGITNIQYTVGGTGTGATISWSPAAPAGIITTYASGLFIIKGTPSSAAGSPYTYTVTTAGTCGPVTATGTITVTPAASLTLTSGSGTDAQTVCNNGTFTNIAYSVNNATSASITSGALPAGVTGGFSGGIFTISGTPTVSGTFSYTVTTSGGCATASATGTITITAQIITLTSGIASPSVCINAPMSNIVYTIGGTANGATATGLPAGVTGGLSGNIFTISGTPTDPAGPYFYTVTTSGTSCGVVTATGTITIQPLAIGGTLTSISICSGSSGSLTLGGPTSGTIVRWEYSTDGGATWIPVANTTISLTYPVLTAPRMYRVVVGNGCGNVFSSVALVGIHNLWTGAINTDWNIAGNWSDNMVPTTSCPVVYIPNTPNKPILGNGTGTINNLQIFAGAILTVNGTGTLQIAGSITNNGIFDASNGAIEFNGASLQTVAATTFQGNAINDLMITSTAGVTLAGAIDINRSLTYNVLNGKLNTGGFLTLKSTATQTAWIGDMTGHIINGNVTVERYIATGNTHLKSWQLLAIPTQGQTIKASWQEGATVALNTINGNTPATNPNPGYGTMLTSDVGGAATQATPGFDALTTPGPSIKVYNSATDGYNGPASTALPIYDQKGYFTLVRGDRSVFTSGGVAIPTVLRTKGVLFTPANVPPLTTVLANKFESVGNPYASAIDLRKLSLSAGVNSTIIVWDPTLGTGSAYGLGAYQTLYLNGDGSNNGTNDYINLLPSAAYGVTGTVNNNIQSGQAFIIQALPATGGTLSFAENAKANGSKLLFRPQAPADEKNVQLRTSLFGITANGSTFIADGTLIQYNDAYSDSVDGMDARKMGNTAENLAIKTAGKLLAIERKHTITTEDTIFFNLTGVKVQSYQFVFETDNLNTGLKGFLEDSYLQTRTPLNINGSTVVNFDIVNIAGSYANDRFRIVFTPAVVLPVTFTSVKAYFQDKNINVEWTVENEVNIKQYEVEKSVNGTQFTSLVIKAARANGAHSVVYVITDTRPVEGYNYYRIKSIDMNGKPQYSDVVKVLIGSTKQDITIHPNPITDGNIHLQLMNQPEGKYGIRLLNKIGQVIVSKQISHAEGSSTEIIKWDFNLAHGMYVLEVTRPDGNVKVINVMY